ncbi:MAG: WD40 repeat domain-containing protein [Acidobacteriia bacterium]|nr:WD40 repeat domain-containing protein [Terriglobia bacterium]
MRKLAFVVFISAAAAATTELLIQPLFRSAPIHQVSRTTKQKSKATNNQTEQGGHVPGISAPLSGYVADPGGRGVRPIVGLRSFAFLGDWLDLGEDIAGITSSPNQNYVVEVNTDGLASLWLPMADGLGQTSLPGDVSLASRVAPSPSGYSLAIMSEARGVVEIFTSLPNSPALTASVNFSELGGTPKRLALSDDGTTLLFTLRNGARDQLYSWRGTGAAQFILDAADITSVAFAPNSSEGAAADGGSDRVFVIHNQDGVFVSMLLASEAAGLARPMAAEFSRDGRKLVVANSVSRTVQVFGLDGILQGSAICNCNPHLLVRMAGNAVFRVTGFDGSIMHLFDGDSDPVAAEAIGILATDTPDASSSVPPTPAAGGPNANVAGAVVSAVQPSNTCATPGTQRYYVQNGTVYPWVSFSNLATGDTASVRVFDSRGVSVGSAPIPLTRISTSTTSCFYLSTGIPMSGLGAGNYTMQFYDTTGQLVQSILFTMVSNQVTLNLTGTRQALPGANAQTIQVAIPTALPDVAAVQVNANFAANQVLNVPAGVNSPTYDCRITQSPVSVTISAGQLQSAVSIPISAGTVAGSCNFVTGQMSIGSGFAFSPPPSQSAALANAPDVPFLNAPTITPGNPFTVQVTGWSTRRDLNTITYTFTARSGSTLATSQFPKDIRTDAVTWFTDARSNSTGGSFSYSQTFNISGGTSSNLQSVSITVNSTAGNSQPVSVNFP